MRSAPFRVRHGPWRGNHAVLRSAATSRGSFTTGHAAISGAQPAGASHDRNATHPR
jgi:hypothetical protein